MYGISRNGQTPYALDDTYHRIVKLFAANMRNEPDAHWTIMRHCDGCGIWFNLAEGIEGFHSIDCMIEAEESWRADNLEDA